jgi:hypothetical protein
MPVKYLVTQDGKLVIEKWVGAIRHEELISHERQQLQDESIFPGAKVFADARQATFTETSYDLIHELSDLYGESDNKTSLSTLAILISGADFDKARIYAEQAQKHGVRIIVFSNFDVACTWLGMKTSEVHRLINAISI